MMKNLFWAFIGIATAIIVAQGYALYKIPQVHYIKGQLTYNRDTNIPPGTIFKLSLESRPQGDKQFNIISASEQNIFNAFPQNFTLPVLKKSLSVTGIYQLRVEIIKDNQLLYSNRELLPLTRDELNRPLNVVMQTVVQAQVEPIISALSLPTVQYQVVAMVPVQTQSVEQVEPIVSALPLPDAEDQAVEIVEMAEPVKLDIVGLLGNKHWVLEGKEKKRPYLTFDIQKNSVFGSGGCNDFQGGYQIDENLLVMKQFISTAKRCAAGMEAETNFLGALNKVSEWGIEEGKLRFYDKNKSLLLQFNSQ